MENFRIESLEINKIGAFEHIKMDFPKKTDPDKAEIHILTGENGTGKSTVLMLLASIADNSNNKNIHLRTWRLNNSINSNPESFYHLDLNICGRKEVFLNRNPHTGKKVTEVVQQRLYGFQLQFSTSLKYGFFAYSGNRFTETVIPNESEYSVGNPIENAVNFTKSTDSSKFLTWILSNKTKSLIASSNGDKEQENLYTNTLKEIEKAIFDIIGVDIQFILQAKPNIHVAIKLDSVIIDIDILPDGIKSIISWLGNLLMRLEIIHWDDTTSPNILDKNFILFLDEIEVHLHPAWQRKILPVVQKLFKNAQIFISTHSPFVVGSVDGAWVHKLKKDGTYAVLDGEPVLSEDGKSVRRILDETFGINEQYGVDVEKDLEKFREFRQKIMMGQEYNSNEFNQLVKHLASQSTELGQMMGMEMNQLKRITQKELV
jgi:predicted ATP-binding protein involved in virulence